MMTLHLKSLSLSPGTALELHGFYNKDRDLIHAPCAILNYSGGSIATRLSISESLFPCGKSFSGLEGFLLLPEGKAEPLFWAASVNALPVGFSLISAEELSRSPEEVSPVESSPSPEEVSVHAAEIKPEESETVETTGSETAETSSETVTSAPTTESVKSDIDSAESAGTQPVTSTKAVRSVDPVILSILLLQLQPGPRMPPQFLIPMTRNIPHPLLQHARSRGRVIHTPEEILVTCQQ